MKKELEVARIRLECFHLVSELIKLGTIARNGRTNEEIAETVYKWAMKHDKTDK
jgi:hypothetical protein